MNASSQLLLGFGRTGYGATSTFPHAIPTQALRDELFGWEAVEAPLFANFDGQEIAIPNKHAIVRDDLGVVLGIPSVKYAIHQYQDSLVTGVDKILGAGLAVNAAGLTGYGRRAWVSVSLADTVTTAEGVEFLPRLIAFGSHDSTLPTGYKRSALNMICNNMIGTMLKEKSSFQEVKIRHTVNSGLRLESAQQALGILAETEDEFSRAIRELCSEEVTARDFHKFVETLVPIAPDAVKGRGLTIAEGKRETLTDMYHNDPRCAPWSGTAWGVVQTVNTYERWNALVRGTDRDERNQDRDLSDHWDKLDTNTYATLQRVLFGA